MATGKHGSSDVSVFLVGGYNLLGEQADRASRAK
jgi:hypothetical protein